MRFLQKYNIMSTTGLSRWFFFEQPGFVALDKMAKNFIVPFCHLYTIKDAKIFQFKQYTDTQIIHDAMID